MYIFFAERLKLKLNCFFNSKPKNNSATVCNVMIQMVDVGSGGGYLVDNRSLMMSIVGSSRATIVTLHKCY